MKIIIIHKVLHERVKPPGLSNDLLKVIEGREYDLVAALDQADGSQQFQHQGFGPQRVVDQGESYTVDRFTMLDHHVEAIL